VNRAKSAGVVKETAPQWLAGPEGVAKGTEAGDAPKLRSPCCTVMSLNNSGKKCWNPAAAPPLGQQSRNLVQLLDPEQKRRPE
jgi:hypothetical protein